MSRTMSIMLDCGCEVEVREEWEYGCAGDCHPGSYEWNGGAITRPCETHTKEETDER